LSGSKIVAMYRIQNEERWIEKSLESASEICQEIVILDDCSTDNTVNICKKFPKVVDIYERKEPLPLDEVRDKKIIWNLALKRNPEYILSLDGDEIIMPNSKEILFEELKILYPEALVFSFQFLYVWDDPAKIRYDGIYGKTWHPRLLKINNNTSSLTVQETDYPGNLHCGSIPKLEVDDYLYRSNVKILHYGNFDNEIRQKKISYYNKIDPNSSEQDDYVHIVSGEGSRSGPKGMEFLLLPDFLLS
jgi:glycosyltransferase involved in cell wall biosynthesis